LQYVAEVSTASPLRPSTEHYGRATLPYGVFTRGAERARVGVRVGDWVIDLAAAAAEVRHPHAALFAARSLNPLMECGPAVWDEVRDWVRSLVDEPGRSSVLSEHATPVADVTMLLPIEVADYVDFYASKPHAENAGAIFRPESPALPASWKHLPLGYHGRAGTIVVSGTDVARPRGQRRPSPQSPPVFGPSEKLDLECEVGFIVGQPSSQGTPVSVAEATDHVFGVVLLNDWSARDIQAWENVPLGPSLGKSFATSISAWVVPWSAFSAASVPLPPQHPEVLPYLAAPPTGLTGLDLHLEVAINGQAVSHPEFAGMYWSPAQMLAHLTVNGASLRVGDLFASGTVSGPDRQSYGSLLELSWDGQRPIRLADGSTRGYLEDGDTVTLTGWAPGADGEPVTLGEVSGRIRPPQDGAN
jgi:fumarylacetoacetase